MKTPACSYDDDIDGIIIEKGYVISPEGTSPFQGGVGVRVYKLTTINAAFSYFASMGS